MDRQLRVEKAPLPTESKQVIVLPSAKISRAPKSQKFQGIVNYIYTNSRMPTRLKKSRHHDV